MTAKSDFGIAHIKDELFGTVPDDVSYAGYVQHIRSQQAPKPLTTAEKELALIRQSEEEMRLQPGKRQLLKAVAFPLSVPAVTSLQDLKAGKINYVQLSVNTSGETIELEMAGNIAVNDLWKSMPENHARYHFFTFRHIYNGGRFNNTVFIYSIPGSGGCTIKERMLYSTCKGPLLEFVEQQIELIIVRRLESDDAKEINEQYLLDEIHSRVETFGTGTHGAACGIKPPGFGAFSLPRY
jgi:hypothetical protein